jgi:hypothetical protein
MFPGNVEIFLSDSETFLSGGEIFPGGGENGERFPRFVNVFSMYECKHYF